MSNYRSYNRHFVPAEKQKIGHPFNFEIEQLETKPEGAFTTLDFVVKDNANIYEDIRQHLMYVFDFYKYLDENSKYNIVKYPDKSPTYYIEITVYNEIREPQGLTKTGKKRKDKITLAKVNSFFIKAFNFTSIYNYTLITSLECLQDTLKGVKVLTYDAETSGLDPEFDTIAGINFSTGPRKGYYFAVNHDEQFSEFNLGEPALDIFYEALLNADLVYLFNARFDIRFLEYYKYDLDETKTNIINKKYDFKNIKFVDTQITTYFSDAGWKDHSLSWAEKHFLGYYRPELEDTLKARGISSFNTRLIDPRHLLFYAGQDAISTFELGLATKQYADEFGLSGQIDLQIIYPLMDMENRLIKIDQAYLKGELKKIRERLEKVNGLILKSIGFDINLNSSQQRAQLFESFGLDTGIRTKGGAMSTNKEAVADLIDSLEKKGTEYPEWLKYLGEQSKLQQLESTFFGALEGQVGFRNGRVRLNYRHGVTATGRFSSGKE